RHHPRRIPGRRRPAPRRPAPVPRARRAGPGRGGPRRGDRRLGPRPGVLARPAVLRYRLGAALVRPRPAAAGGALGGGGGLGRVRVRAPPPRRRGHPADAAGPRGAAPRAPALPADLLAVPERPAEIGRASCRERVEVWG